jgi:transposase-like protein
MEMNTQLPETLVEVVKHFADPDNCLAFAIRMRWPDAVVRCPRCDSERVSFVASRRVWQCKGCRRQFSVKVGTIFEDSPLPLDKWLTAIWLISNCKNGISSCELARDIGVTQKTAWFMLHRIRLSMQGEGAGFLRGEVEVDESYIGGKARNMHKGKRKAKGRGAVGKAVVMGLLERHGEVRAMVVENNKRATLKPIVQANVYRGAAVFTDALSSYEGLSPEYAHQVIDHAECYVKGNIHTNGMENFWSLLKRGIKGTYVAVEPFHLFRYVDEQAFRFNNRKVNDAQRFAQVVRSASGRRLMYKNLIGEGANA